MKTKRAVKVEIELLNIHANEAEHEGDKFKAALMRRRAQYLAADYLANQLTN